MHLYSAASDVGGRIEFDLIYEIKERLAAFDLSG